ncbi:MAG: hypothetical protein U0T74_02735 [Chitinophagales bacterium]
MKKNTLSTALLAALTLLSVAANATEDVRHPKKANHRSTFKTEAGDCTTPQAQFDLDINNVRARLLTGGDLWWNLSEARYAVPKGDGSGISLNALFAGAIWITGYDAGGNLKCAAQRYRAGGDDYWPGPLTGGVVDKATCSKYDRFFNVYGADIDKAQTAFLQKGSSTTLADIPKSLLAWPAKGNQYLATDPSLIGETFNVTDNLAPFRDVDGDGIYDPLKGDYPVILCRGQEAEAYADQMIFWVFNDGGNLHTESNGQAIGVQVNALAFAFQTTDEINNMTFYKYEITNKSSNPLQQTYISQWADPDLGNFGNDRVGCDTTRSLAIVWNGSTPDADNGGVGGYGTDLPIFGIDFFEGPLSDSGQQLGLSSFVYFTNGASFAQSDPSSAAQYRNYMTGFWNDGTPFTSGGTGTGYGGTTPVKYLFPGNPIDANAWSEVQTGVSLAAGDRRTVQTSGPFTLTPGTPQYVTVGCVFVRPSGGVGIPPNFETSIGPADDKAQNLFNTCFKLVDGPDAPTLAIREMKNQIIINLLNLPGSNNEGEAYNQVDGGVAQAVYQYLGGNGDSTYTFEGYNLYQVANATVSATELNDPAKALLIAQVDVKNGIKKVVNFVKDASLNLFIPVLKVDGKDEGITNSFNITQDLFATGSNSQLVNHKTYYYTATAYAYNNYIPYDQANPLAGGQQTPYIQGRGNFRIYSAIPHISDPRNEGTIINAAWGDGVDVKRIEGSGNGGNVLQLTPETIAKILDPSSNSFVDTLVYEKGSDPIGFKVVDPVSLKEADFELQLVDTVTNPIGATTSWILKDLTNNVTIKSDRNLDRPYEQQIFSTSGSDRIDYGFSIKLGTPANLYTIPGSYLATTGAPNRYVYGATESSITFQNPTERWLSFVKDAGTNVPSNWIRSGVEKYSNAANASTESKNSAGVFDDNYYYLGATQSAYPNYTFTDSNEVYENILEGTWAPYCLTANYNNRSPATGVVPYVYGPGFKWKNHNPAQTQQTPPQNTLDRIASVDIVITSDPSKWSRCIVFETGEDDGINIGADFAPNGKAPKKGQLRMQRSMLKDNNGNLYEDPSTTPDTGRSWFPGYAVNVETGERLNIAFGESSDQGDQNGRDMLWNPTSNVYSPLGTTYFGGKHFIYVMDTKYDGCDSAQRLLLDYYNLSNPFSTINPALHPLYRSLMWTSIPYITPGYSFVNGYIPPADVTIKLRVEKPYSRFSTNATSGDPLPRYQFSTKGMGATEKNAEVSKNALDLIRIVPNPYLAYSAYETDQNSSRVKVTNLPNKCEITIFSLDGSLIRKLSRAIDVDPATNKRIDISEGSPANDINLDNTVDWDLKNEKGVPIASGIYLFHIEAPGIGQKTLKWFGAVRPADTSNF